MKLTLGVLGAAHGIRGEMKIRLHTDNPAERLAPGTPVTTASGLTFTVASLRRVAGKDVIGFTEVTDRNRAEELRGEKLVVEVPDTLPADAPADGYYAHQLRGLAAYAPDGRYLGRIVGVLEGVAQDLLEVAPEIPADAPAENLRESDGSEVLVPFVEEIVTEIDGARGRVEIDAPGGLFPEEA